MGTEMDIPSYEEELLNMVEECEFLQDELSEWEQGFIESVGSRIRANIPLTVKQAEKLFDIHEKALDKELFNYKMSKDD